MIIVDLGELRAVSHRLLLDDVDDREVGRQLRDYHAPALNWVDRALEHPVSDEQLQIEVTGRLVPFDCLLHFVRSIVLPSEPDVFRRRLLLLDDLRDLRALNHLIIKIYYELLDVCSHIDRIVDDELV